MRLFNIFKKKKIKYSNKKEYNQQVDEIKALANKYQKLTIKQLKSKTAGLQLQVKKGAVLKELLVESYAIVVAAAPKILHLNPFLVQIYGAIVLFNGDVAEMKTGEGKTLTSAMPIYLNALSGKGVHVITVNEYLAERDATEMGKLFVALGLSVGYNQQGANRISKKLAYSLDITYSIHSELGFDYLRDNMCINLRDRVMRGLNVALIDECDSILIDDARTPLIISGGVKEKDNLYDAAEAIVITLTKKDYKKDEESKAISLTGFGAKKVEEKFMIKNLYDREHTILHHHIQQALQAHFALTKGIDYIIRDNELILIDQNTGRALEGRTYSDGLHQAIQAKEHLIITAETKTIATITYQNLFRLYNKLSGMTGTAITEEEEFLEIYNMRVEVIQTNKPIIRKDYEDYIFGTENGMHQALIDEVIIIHNSGQPILIGTRSVEVSEDLSNKLTIAKLKHVVLNAKNNRKESKIIKNAGQKNQITIATNIAGRGTDIKLGVEVAKLGGLAVIGCERHESRRIDNQLIGRSGRQGSPGYSRFYISWEDELLIRFAGDRAKAQAARMGDIKFESKIFSKMINAAQIRIEGQNFDARKQLVEFDDVIRKQREAIYYQRDQVLVAKDIFPVIETMYGHVAKIVCSHFVKWIDKEKYVRGNDLKIALEKKAMIDSMILDVITLNKLQYDAVITYVKDSLLQSYHNKHQEIGRDIFLDAERNILLQIIDAHWQNHIDTMTKLRSGIHLRSYAQLNPLQVYIKEGYHLFEDMKSNISHQIVFALKSVVLKKDQN